MRNVHLPELYTVKQLTSYSNFFINVSLPVSVRQNKFLSPEKDKINNIIGFLFYENRIQGPIVQN